ncbi:helix-turn-helix domain-containing protein [Arthrobacter sp. LFS091]|uniref:helix-turn-helix domain-containing protein n=1 Tax=Arthrobacter sp. LFS091 TaxID=3229892 RepID=UPI003A80D8D5
MFTAAELAGRLSVSTATVRAMCNSGKWPHTRIGRLYRFSEEHYQAIIATPQPPEPWTKERQKEVAMALRRLSDRS